uniref:MFS general substrate transporter n=1 Tax=Phaffia rhodozyma TaxID=264483 RepID=A0A1I9Q732_PHARH|nr:MFS general substrate transporter [Phaffia rhodozyma]
MDSVSATSTLTELPTEHRIGSADAQLGEKEPKMFGNGTPGDPFVVEFTTNDRDNPREWSKPYRWFLSIQGSVQMLAITFGTSGYTGGYPTMTAEFGSSNELNTVGLTTFVIGLAVGALVWAPLSEILGRRRILLSSLFSYSLIGMGVALSQNIWSIIICRFFMAIAGSSIMTNSPGMLNDLWRPSEIGLPMTLNSVAPFMGPVLGPVLSGFISVYAGDQSWRWVNGVIVMFSAGLLLLAVFTVPETYPATVLQQKAKKLSKSTGLVYESEFEVGQPKKPFSEVLSTGLKRPFIFLFLEPIVICLSFYASLIFGILYLFFEAYPIIYVEQKGWRQDLGNLPFLGVAIGLIFGVAISFYTSSFYKKALRACKLPTDKVPPEERLYFTMISAILLPISLFWMAWTSDVFWIWPTLAGIPFGIGILGMMTTVMAYLADTYTIYSASVFAANSLFRYIFGGVFPLFASAMFHKLHTTWALSLLGFLALACAPMPFLFFKYGARIRALSKHVPEPPRPSKRLTPPASLLSLQEQDSDLPRAPPPVFLTAGDQAVRVEEAMDGIDFTRRQDQDLERL